MSPKDKRHTVCAIWGITHPRIPICRVSRAPTIFRSRSELMGCSERRTTRLGAFFDPHTGKLAVAGQIVEIGLIGQHRIYVHRNNLAIVRKGVEVTDWIRMPVSDFAGRGGDERRIMPIGSWAMEPPNVQRGPQTLVRGAPHPLRGRAGAKRRQAHRERAFASSRIAEGLPAGPFDCRRLRRRGSTR